MSHDVVMITQNEDGIKVDSGDQVWCLSTIQAGSPATYCTGEVYGYGEGDALYKSKRVKRGGITCDHCLELIKEIKSIKL